MIAPKTPTGTVTEGMADTDYFAVEAISASAIKSAIDKSPKHFKAYLDGLVVKTSDAMDFGSAVHCALLEPEKFDDKYVAYDGTRRGKAYDAFVAENDGKIILKSDAMAKVKAVCRSVKAHPVVNMIRKQGGCETVLQWKQSWNDVEFDCKAKLDKLTIWQGKPLILDVKTTADASYGKFSRDIATFHYDVQAAWYVNGAEKCGLGDAQFVFIAVEKEPPFAVAARMLGWDTLEDGRKTYSEVMQRFSYAKKTGKYEGFTENGVEVIDKPKWAMRYVNQD